MIRLWLSRDNAIPIREQLSAQLLLGILSRRLAPDERLPSVRDLARRLHIHANTVSAVYRDLAARGWVTERRGSGVYVRNVALPARQNGIEGFLRASIQDGLLRGFALDALESAWSKVVNEFRAHHLLVIDPDAELARVLAREIEEATAYPVSFAALEDARQVLTSQTCVLALPAHKSRVEQELGDVPHRTIGLKSMQDILVGRERPRATSLIAVVSRSDSILDWASTLISALGFSQTAVLLRNPRHPEWQRGLKSCDIVAVDVEARNELADAIEPTVFRIVSEEFLAQIRAMVGC